jgi:hypothetical protein
MVGVKEIRKRRQSRTKREIVQVLRKCGFKVSGNKFHQEHKDYEITGDFKITSNKYGITFFTSMIDDVSIDKKVKKAEDKIMDKMDDAGLMNYKFYVDYDYKS